ncbi:optic atrophy 3 protein [Marchantia polymorpha subsp. ruderalis]|uniref:OPA3-like protein n=2 Tax=Marchantia polymorpha TaxID=3197 RepID=A0A176WMV2_MARPO|nr:hypothetical protein AXG93_1593s1630 [Marchantia polymorpha subsp. ruderalis]PTQ29074.1 hypothetical protein MARPO_0148s0024 [Marchantia polymorpha]BBN09080.1 hypothetical protein Mp_4g16960 [Marchantia polymorpha subsp. ruderalis]|eukprot:PTQ29074.1 hypothetical protein MARPO_0148s0024 [Marchantia polymorpha]
MILPVAKLGTFVLKTLSKPLASRLKTQATRHPRFRQSIINFAQANHKFQVNLQRRIYGHATNVEIRPLDEEKAVQAASDFLGEFVVFSIGGGLLVFEVQRSARSEARKEEARKQEVEGLRSEVTDLMRRLEDLEKSMKGGRGLASWLNVDTKQAPSS